MSKDVGALLETVRAVPTASADADAINALIVALLLEIAVELALTMVIAAGTDTAGP